MQSGVIGLFAFSCILFSLLVYAITKGRINHFDGLERKALATKDPFWSNIHGLAIFCLLAFMVADFFFVLADSNKFCELNQMLFGSHCHTPNYFQSLLMGDERVGTEGFGVYVFALIIPIFWTSWAFKHEIGISKKLRDARNDLLLGRMVENNDGSWADTRDTRTTPTQELPSQPATFEAVLQAMEAELERAVDAAKFLKRELDETKRKVVSLEEEVQVKDVEIQQIKESKSNFDKMISENSKTEDGDTKSLSLTDSVMVGDSVMGGVKIDKQINNDPEAIARAVIDAYRMGKSDSD